MNNKKNLWIAAGILLAVILCGMAVWLSGGIAGMINAHMGM